MKKGLIALTTLFSICALASCGDSSTPQVVDTGLKGSEYVASLSSDDRSLLYDYGYIGSNLPDFSQYLGTDYYVKVNTADELIKALYDARVDYTTTMTKQLEFDYMVRNNVRKNETNWIRAITKGLYLKNEDGTYTKIPEDTPWDANDPVYTADLTYYEDSAYPDVEWTQTLNSPSKVHVIEICDDIDLGYKKLSTETKTDYASIVEKWDETKVDNMTRTTWYNNNIISRVAIERTTDLLIYSQNGAKITHGGFKINYDKNVVIRNLEFDEMWQWEDWNSSSAVKKLGDYDTVGWAYFKIGYSENIMIDHCKFGKSFDGQIDVANTYYNSLGTYTCAPYGATGGTAVHISYCDFTGGSDDEDGYLYQMMQKIEENYQAGGTNYCYYNALRKMGLTFEDILYGIAIPQKKGFLLGDSGTDVKYNKELRVSIANCRFKNIEDRIPKVRTGVAYMYNTVIDNHEYYEYREKFRELGVEGSLKAINSNWKCGMVSQGIVCGNGGSVCAQNVIFRGIYSVLKDNDSEITNNTGLPFTTAGGYRLINCSNQLKKDDPISTTDFSNASPGLLTESNFSFKTEDGNPPFTVKEKDLSTLDTYLATYVGTNNKMKQMFLTTSYN
ncbi:MAG: hypothetical protein ACI35W_06240 [Anaeroplasmataceae bacterium]